MKFSDLQSKQQQQIIQTVAIALPTTSSSSISRLIKQLLEEQYIKPIDPNTAPRYMKYIPVWA
jgi:hypothetical protein